MIRISDLKDGQPIKVLQSIYCMDTIIKDGDLLRNLTGAGDNEVNLYFNGKQFIEDIHRVAIKDQCGQWNGEFNRIDFRDNSGLTMYIVDLRLEELPEELFELCSQAEIKEWFLKNVEDL